MKRQLIFADEQDFNKIDLKEYIILHVDIPLYRYQLKDTTIASSSSIEWFPGRDKFKDDVAKILEDEYHFQIIESEDNGKKQKGVTSNRPDSSSIYFNTLFDFSKNRDIVKKFTRGWEVPDRGVVNCFIYLRFSDHLLNDYSDSLHRNFVRNNIEEHLSQNPNITHFIKDQEEFILDERKLYQHYSDALVELRDDIEARFVAWIKKLKRREEFNA